MIDQETTEGNGCYMSKSLETLLITAREILMENSPEEHFEFNEKEFLKDKFYLSESCFEFYDVKEY